MKIMLIDDHPLFRNALRGLLEKKLPDALFIECDTAAESETIFHEQAPDFVIADLELLDDNSLALIAKMKKYRPKTPILILSMHEESHLVKQALEAGADGYVTKRDGPEEVAAGIDELMRDNQYLSPAASAALLKSFQAKPYEPAIDFQRELSKREYEVFTLLGRELSRKQIAQDMHIAVPTVDTHIERIKQKLDLETTHKLVCLAIKTATKSNMA